MKIIAARLPTCLPWEDKTSRHRVGSIDTSLRGPNKLRHLAVCVIDWRISCSRRGNCLPALVLKNQSDGTRQTPPATTANCLNGETFPPFAARSPHHNPRDAECAHGLDQH